MRCFSTGMLINPEADQEGNKLQRKNILMFIYPIYYHNWRNISKGKAIPLQTSRGPQGSRRLRSPDFLTSAHEGGKFSALRTARLYHQE